MTTDQDPRKKFSIIRALIQRGVMDDYLDRIKAECYARTIEIAEQKAGQVEVGDYIILTNIKPKMLDGIRVRVTGFEGVLIKCEMLTTVSPKWRRGILIRIRRTHIGTVVKGADNSEQQEENGLKSLYDILGSGRWEKQS